MDCQIFYEGTDITNQVVSYDRDKALCTGIGVARVSIKRTASVTPGLYKRVVIYEGGHNKGTYWIHTIDRDLPANTLTLNCQNGSIKLQDYFIDQSYLVDYASTSDYWIRKFLDAATVSYSFDSGDTGTLVSNNTSLGMCTAYDAILPLLLQNGWYMSFDADDVCHIGELAIDGTAYKATLTDSTILSLQKTDHDRMFRNRAIVWGNANPTKHRWVYYDLDQHGKFPNEYPGGHDIRPVVIANGNIKEASSAAWIAQKAIKAFAHPQREITLDVAGAVDVDTGDYVYVGSKFHRGAGIVTTEGSSMSSNGLITHLVLNQECPRLFSFYDWGGYIYVGTAGNGVWRKPLKVNHTWSNFSTGLTDLNITDLAVDAGVFACVSQGGKLFIRTETDATWIPFTPTLTDTLTYSGQSMTFPAGSGMATTCTIDKDTGEIIAGFSLRVVGSGDPARSWLYYINNASNYKSYQLQDEEGLTEFTIVDLDNNGTNDLVSVDIHSSGLSLIWNDVHHKGGYDYRNTNLITPEQALASGFGLVVVNDGSTIRRFNWHEENVVGDGEYVLDVTSQGFSDFSVYTPSTQLADVTGADTVSGVIRGAFTLGEGVPSDQDARYFQAVGNYGIAYTDYYFVGNDTRNPSKIALRLGPFLAQGGYGKEYQIPGSILEDDKWLPLATLGKSDGPTSKYYVLFGEKDGVNLKLCWMDFNNLILHTVATGAVPTTLAGGTCFGCSRDEIQGFSFDDTLAFLFSAGYYPVDVNGSNESVGLPIVVFYHQGSGHLFVNSSAASVLHGLDPDFGYGSNYGGAGAMLEDLLYASFIVGGGEYLLEFSATGYCTAIFGTGSYSSKLTNAVGNKKHLYFVVDDNTGTFLRMVNVRARAVERSFLVNNPYTKVISQLDDADDSFYVYNAVTGNVTQYPASGVGSNVYYFGAKANLDDIYILDDPDPHPIETFESYASLVGDIFYLKSVAYTGPVGAFDYYVRRSEFAIYPNISGERLMPRPYTVLPGEGTMVLQGYKENTYMTVLDSSTTPFHIDASSNFPWAVWGNRSYSGYAFSGIDPWGWNQAQLWVSPTGGKDTYTTVLLDALHSYIPDLRSCNMYSGYADPDNSTYNRYLVFPQPTTNLPGAGGSNLLLVDMASVYNTPGIVVTSGTLNQSCTILNVFDDYIDHVETTNTQDVPYIFVSKSGVPTKFYQRDGYTVLDLTDIPTSGFVDRTSNLPTGYAITCIRADDQI